MAEKEIIFTIPLRKEFLKVPRYKRSKKAVNAVREFLKKHMKSEDVRIGKYLNKKILERGRKNPLHKIQVKVVKEENIVKAELVGAPVEEKKEEGKKPKKKEKVGEKEKEEKEKIEEKREEKKEEVRESKTEKEKEEKKEILEKGLEKKERPEEKREVEDKEKAVMTGEEKIYKKPEKPHHEKKK